jgi:hypothetical protein
VALTYMDENEYADASDPGLRGGGGNDRRNWQRLSAAEAAYQWLRCNEEAEHVLTGLDSARQMQVRYEDLCIRPDAAWGALCAFLGLEAIPLVRDYRSVEHHVVGNGMRLNNASKIQLDERWKTALTDQDLLAIDRVAGEMNRRYGYV